MPTGILGTQEKRVDGEMVLSKVLLALTVVSAKGPFRVQANVGARSIHAYN